MSKYIELNDLEVYQLARELSTIGWKIYDQLSWKKQKIIGDQFIRSTDSVGANIAEGYGRFHYLDKIRFYYNSRGSYMEAKEHWLELMYERKIISKNIYETYKSQGEKLLIKLNNLISQTYKAKQKWSRSKKSLY